MIETLVSAKTGQTIERPYIPSAEPPAPDPAEELAEWRATAALTFGQTLIQLQALGLITEAEGNDWMAGTALPSDIETLIASLPENIRFAARVRAMTPSVVLRLNPLVQGLALMRGVSDEALDQLFREGKHV